ncbi:flagellar biosynthesis anti-sigma factor FlgM [Caloranaerobacter sp. DY30410]|uniref:flagellar biosynthesis anti-sigma factor FlgM n=1 Tax=Caloranaerobacter sp. DY30410 TaxID=3238305 RepID=UPI003CFD3C66
MKIINNNIYKALKLYNSQKQIKDKKTSAKAEKKDKLSLSNKAIEYQIAMKALRNVPDIRKDKVEEIKRQIETGTYKIDSSKIVEKMFENVNIDKRV